TRHRICDCRFPIADFKEHLQSAIWQSTIVNVLVGLFAVIGSGFDAARHLSLPFLFLISLLAGVDSGGHGSRLAGRGIASSLGHFADSFSRLRIKFTGASAGLFVILTGAVAQLSGRLA